MVRNLLDDRSMPLASNMQSQKGFTLVEMMIVIVILGILAAIAIISFRKYVQHAKTSEVYTMLGDIRAKQEGYRAEFSQYCDVSGNHQLSDGGRFPATAPRSDGTKVAWTAPSVRWQQLGFAAHAPVYASYTVASGLPTNSCTGSCPTMNINDHWWAAWGILDLDGDGTFSTYEAINATTDVVAISEFE